MCEGWYRRWMHSFTGRPRPWGPPSWAYDCRRLISIRVSHPKGSHSPLWPATCPSFPSVGGGGAAEGREWFQCDQSPGIYPTEFHSGWTFHKLVEVIWIFSEVFWRVSLSQGPHECAFLSVPGTLGMIWTRMGEGGFCFGDLSSALTS